MLKKFLMPYHPYYIDYFPSKMEITSESIYEFYEVPIPSEPSLNETPPIEEGADSSMDDTEVAVREFSTLYELYEVPIPSEPSLNEPPNEPPKAIEEVLVDSSLDNTVEAVRELSSIYELYEVPIPSEPSLNEPPAIEEGVDTSMDKTEVAVREFNRMYKEPKTMLILEKDKQLKNLSEMPDDPGIATAWHQEECKKAESTYEEIHDYLE